MAPKVKPAAFVFFMKDWKREQERKGKKFSKGLDDVRQDPECSAAWNRLSAEQRAVYKKMEKDEKENPTMNLGRKAGKKDKLTGLGESINEIEKEEMRKMEFEDRMRDYIHTTVTRAKKMGNLQSLKFYVIHVNFFYIRILDNNQADYHPAEVALIEFSMKDGITNVYTELVNEKIFIGYSSDAKTMSATTHNIPPESPFAELDYEKVFRNIINILEPSQKNGKYPPLFTCNAIVAPVTSFLQRACYAADRRDDFFLLYSFENLFTSIYTALIDEADVTPFQDVIAKMEIERDPYAYRPGLECDFHNEINAGVLHCSLSIVKRWVYVLFSNCCNLLGIELLEDTHKPINVTKPGFSVSSLNTSMKSLALSDMSKRTQALSMTGVSEQYRESVSERTFKDDIRRRMDGKPVSVVDHSKLIPTPAATPAIPKTIKEEPLERPLRLPRTKSAAPMLKELESESLKSAATSSIDLGSEDSFPALGSRVAAIRKRANNGYAGALKK